RWQHDRGDRTQPGRDQDRRLDRGPGARGWPPRRAGHRPGHAGRGGRQSRFLHRPVPGQGAAGRWRRRIDPGQDEVEEEVSRMSDTTREPLFRFPVTPRWRDLDAFNHVNNSNFLTYLEEARIRMFASLGKPWFDEHMAPLLAAGHSNHRAPTAYPSELVVELYADRVGNSTGTVGHRIVDAGDGRLYPDGHVVMVWIDRASGKPTALPESSRELAA